MIKVLNIISLIGSFLIVFGIVFLLQSQTIGKLPILRDLIVFKIFKFQDLLFTATTLLFILKFIDFYIPSRKN
jgi:hypothetical protein